MSTSELDREAELAIRGRRAVRARLLVALAVGFAAGVVGYLVAFALGCSTSCATGRSPMTFALLIGFTAACAAASGMPNRAGD